MEKRMIDRFTEEFEKHLSHDLSRNQSFEKAKESFEKICGFTAYSSYNSYKCSKWQYKNKYRDKYRK